MLKGQPIDNWVILALRQLLVRAGNSLRFKYPHAHELDSSCISFDAYSILMYGTATTDELKLFPKI